MGRIGLRRSSRSLQSRARSMSPTMMTLARIAAPIRGTHHARYWMAYSARMRRRYQVNGTRKKGDPAMARYAQQHLDSILEHPHATTADKVRQFVRALLPSGRCSIEESAHLGMDRRTVHRHLAHDT